MTLAMIAAMVHCAANIMFFEEVSTIAKAGLNDNLLLLLISAIMTVNIPLTMSITIVSGN